MRCLSAPVIRWDSGRYNIVSRSCAAVALLYFKAFSIALGSSSIIQSMSESGRLP